MALKGHGTRPAKYQPVRNCVFYGLRRCPCCNLQGRMALMRLKSQAFPYFGHGSKGSRGLPDFGLHFNCGSHTQWHKRDYGLRDACLLRGLTVQRE